ncbi:unnamed protein product [Ceratitis capitata]|uniref:(Mediterranean fruit fly) hypothetical protein n=1 Tax=Ceratitis capitata TaxID=7213 RepID=A0A811V441_CERCA|nr:unnamed protein product [Ceratitis capitata]
MHGQHFGCARQFKRLTIVLRRDENGPLSTTAAATPRCHRRLATKPQRQAASSNHVLRAGNELRNKTNVAGRSIRLQHLVSTECRRWRTPNQQMQQTATIKTKATTTTTPPKVNKFHGDIVNAVLHQLRPCQRSRRRLHLKALKCQVARTKNRGSNEKIAITTKTTTAASTKKAHHQSDNHCFGALWLMLHSFFRQPPFMPPRSFADARIVGGCRLLAVGMRLCGVCGRKFLSLKRCGSSQHATQSLITDATVVTTITTTTSNNNMSNSEHNNNNNSKNY